MEVIFLTKQSKVYRQIYWKWYESKRVSCSVVGSVVFFLLALLI